MLDDAAIEPFVSGDDPFDENFKAPFFGLYGVDEAGMLEHIVDRASYDSMLELASKLAPGVTFPRNLCFDG